MIHSILSVMRIGHFFKIFLYIYIYSFKITRNFRKSWRNVFSVLQICSDSGRYIFITHGYYSSHFRYFSKYDIMLVLSLRVTPYSVIEDVCMGLVYLGNISWSNVTGIKQWVINKWWYWCMLRPFEGGYHTIACLVHMCDVSNMCVCVCHICVVMWWVLTSIYF